MSRGRACSDYAMARTDDKPRGEAEFTQTILRREGRRRTSKRTFKNNKIKLGYGTTVALETLVAFAKSNTAADLMWYICRVFGLPLPLKVAVALRILLLTTGGWALISGIKEVCPKLAKAIQNR